MSSSPFPVLNNRPIDQWKVTELKDELRRRRLPVTGLKEVLVRRLDEALHNEISQADEVVGPPTLINAGAIQAPAVVAADISQVLPVDVVTQAQAAEVPEVSEVAATEKPQDPVIAVAEVGQVAVSETAQDPAGVDVAEVTQVAISDTTESAAVVVAEVRVPEVAVGEVSVNETTPTKGEEFLDGLQSVPHNASSEEALPPVEAHKEAIWDRTPQIDNSVQMVNSDYILSGVTTMDFHSDADEANKIQEEEKVPPPADATVSDAVAMDTSVDATATEKVVEDSMVHDNDLKDNDVVHGEESNDSKLPNEHSKSVITEQTDQVLVVSPELGSQIKCESISNDSLSINEKNNLKDNLKSDNFDLEQEVKLEMVQPSSGTAHLDGGLQPIEDDKELVKNQSLENLDYTTNIDSSKKEDSPDGGPPEKLNLDRSSGDESMEEDVMESKPFESNIRSDDLAGKNEVGKGHAMKDAILPDVAVEGTSADTEGVAAEDKTKPAPPVEKRKNEDQEFVANNEPVKRQRRWNMENVKVQERQMSNATGSGTPKDVFQPALRRSFGKSDSAASGDSPKERVVPPSQKPATTSLRVDQFVRPFTLKAVQELLGKSGSVSIFWMDHIKTHCYVTYSSVDEAVATRNAVYNLQWPPNGGNYLVADFVDPQEVKLKVEAPPPSPAPISPIPATTPRTPFQQNQASLALARQNSTREQLPPPPPLLKPPTLDPAPITERLPPPPPKKPEPPVVTLDDLFRKTKASPRIYYLPLSEEQVRAKFRENMQ